MCICAHEYGYYYTHGRGMNTTMKKRFELKTINKLLLTSLLIIALTACSTTNDNVDNSRNASAESDEIQLTQSLSDEESDTVNSTDGEDMLTTASPSEENSDKAENSGNATDNSGDSKTASATYKDVLSKEGEIFYAYSGEWKTLEQYIAGSDASGVFVSSFAMVDLDNDGESEVVLQICKGNDSADIIEVLVLRDYDGAIYSYSLAARELSDLKSDGTFWFSSGAADSGFGRILFSEKSYVINKITYSESSYDSNNNQTVVYFVDDKSATLDEYNSAVNKQDEKTAATWHEYTTKSIDGVLSNVK